MAKEKADRKEGIVLMEIQPNILDLWRERGLDEKALEKLRNGQVVIIHSDISEPSSKSESVPSE